MKSRSEFSSKEEYLNYLRVYYAGLAMQGLLATFNIHHLDDLAIFAVSSADALITELNKETT